MIDGVFAVAITLIPVSIPNSLEAGTGYRLPLLTASVVLIGLTMALMWHKLRSVIKFSKPLYPFELGLIAIVCALAVLIPKCAYLAFMYGTKEGSFWYWSDAQWVNIEYQFLIMIYELVIVMLLFKACAKDGARKVIAGKQNAYKAIELTGMLVIAAGILCENLLTGVNGVYLYLVPLVFSLEEIGYIVTHNKPTHNES